jgi:hypothetical protein
LGEGARPRPREPMPPFRLLRAAAAAEREVERLPAVVAVTGEAFPLTLAVEEGMGEPRPMPS